MRERTIKFTVVAKKWFDRINGNTYHSVRCIRCKDRAVVVGQFQYGYGEYYKQTALRAMADAKWLPFRYRSLDEQFHYERENNYPIQWIFEGYGLKRDCVANGIL